MRAETRDVHERLDRHLADADPSLRAGLRRILTVHAAAVPPIERALAGWHMPGGVPLFAGYPMTRALRSDLRALGASWPEPVCIGPVAPAAELGLAYVLTGSRLGNRLLRKVWERSADPVVRRAGAYLSWREGEEAWPHLVRHLDAEGRGLPDWGPVVAGARSGFEMFLHAIKTPESEAA